MRSVIGLETSFLTLTGGLPQPTQEKSEIKIPDYIIESPLSMKVLGVREQPIGTQIDCLVHKEQTGLIKFCREQPELARKLNIAATYFADGYYITTCPNAQRFNFLSEMMIIEGDPQAPFFQLFEVDGGINSEQAFNILWSKAMPQATTQDPYCLHDIHEHLAGMLILPNEVAEVIYKKALSLEKEQGQEFTIEKSDLAAALDVITNNICTPVKNITQDQRNEIVKIIYSLGLSDCQAERLKELCFNETIEYQSQSLY